MGFEPHEQEAALIMPRKVPLLSEAIRKRPNGDLFVHFSDEEAYFDTNPKFNEYNPAGVYFYNARCIPEFGSGIGSKYAFLFFTIPHALSARYAGVRRAGVSSTTQRRFSPRTDAARSRCLTRSKPAISRTLSSSTTKRMMTLPIQTTPS